MSEAIDLGLGVLDHQLVDRDGRRCGKVDDLELAGGPGETLAVTHILVGAPAWRGRGRLGRLAARLAAGRTVRVPWSEVEKLDAAVHLNRRADELRLGRGDDRLRPWLERLPGA
jgi:sporulation protein YlmC with PRC-barrel domain